MGYWKSSTTAKVWPYFGFLRTMGALENRADYNGFGKRYDKNSMKVIHVVRHYGPVGGMERYVWELTRELAAAGCRIIVLCEQSHAAPSAGIAIHELGRLRPRPRWLAYFRFSRRVQRWLAANPQPGWIIHSHERVGVHDVTTFHGPPFATVRDKPWWTKLSIRVVAQLWLERRELAVARAIVPNSAIIAKQLAHYYPEYAHKLTAPVVPGVAPRPLRPSRGVASDGGIVGFVGREWQRKGLPLAVAVMDELRKSRPQAELWVIGPEPSEVAYLFEGWTGGYRLVGWQGGEIPYQEFDLLFHPARAEPYGMVISEAMAAAVPVVVSDACGAAEQVDAKAGEVVPLAAPIGHWVAALNRGLARTDSAPSFVRGWDQVANEFIAVYSPLAGGER